MRPVAFSFGDLVMLRAGGSPGIIAEMRRSDCRVQFLGDDRSVWAPLRDLRLVRPEEVEGSLERLVADLLRLLRADELEFTTVGQGRRRLSASHGAIVPETIDRLRELFGARLRACVIRPQGMHRIQTTLEFD